jgi:hypothetical protein
LASAIAALGLAIAILPPAVYNLLETAGGGHGGHMAAEAMACAGACAGATAVGAAIALAAVASLFLSGARQGVAASAVLLAGGVAAIAVPRLLGFCSMASMPCVYLTKPTLAVLGAAVIALSAARLARGVAALRGAAAAA